MSTIRAADGTALFVRDWGGAGGVTGSAGPPVVFVASWSLPSDQWAYQMLALLEAGLRPVAFDRRGHGRSDDPGGGYDFDTLADDLGAVMDGLDLRRAVLVGFSMGAGEVVRYVTRHGADRVAGLVLIGGTPPMLQLAPDNPDGVASSVFEAFRRECLMRDFPGWVDANMVPFVAPETPPGLRNWVRDMALRTSLQALVECNRALTAADFRAELRGIAVPTLVIHGDADQTCPLPLTGRRTAALVSGADLLVYEGAPHGLFLTHRERLNADLIAFAGRTRRKGSAPLRTVDQARA